MHHPLSQRDKLLSFFTVGFLLTAGVSFASTRTRTLPFLTDTPVANHHLLSPDARYIRTQKNSDLLIAIPDARTARYKIRFFDEDNRLLFEIRQLRDSMLILEKYNFQHAGLFQYALYKDDILLERSSFTIKRE